MSLRIVTFCLVFAGLAAVWLQLYNRLLLQIRDTPRKAAWHQLAIAFVVALPTALLLISWHTEPVQEALSWRPATPTARVLFGLFGLLWVFSLWRVGLWLGDRLFPVRSRHLVEDRVAQAPVPRAPNRLPRPLRHLETTYDLEIVEREIRVPCLAAEFDGLKIAHVADTHFDPRFGRRAYYAAIIDIVNAHHPEVVAFTGDFINHPRLIPLSAAYHAKMRGRLATLAVFGNHDHWTELDAMRDELVKRGVRPIDESRWVIERAGRRLIIAGTDAPWSKRRAQWNTLLDKRTGDAAILLSHSPDNAPAAARHGANLILSGHMHGGQYCLPLIGPVFAPSRYGHRFMHGVHDISDDCLLSVSRGIGASDAGNRRGGGRMLCRPELVFLTLRSPFAEIAIRAEETAEEISASVAPSIAGQA